MVEDRLLIWRFKAGDKAALARIYEKYEIDLLRIATGLANEISVAEDVVHDVFVTFAQSSDSPYSRGFRRQHGGDMDAG